MHSYQELIVDMLTVQYITDNSVETVIKECLNLTQLDLHNCPLVSQNAKLKLGMKDVSKKTQQELKW